MILIINMITQDSFHPRMITQCSFRTCIINIIEEQRATSPESSGEYNWNIKTLNVISLCAYRRPPQISAIHDQVVAQLDFKPYVASCPELPKLPEISV